MGIERNNGSISHQTLPAASADHAETHQENQDDRRSSPVKKMDVKSQLPADNPMHESSKSISERFSKSIASLNNVEENLNEADQQLKSLRANLQEEKEKLDLAAPSQSLHLIQSDPRFALLNQRLEELSKLYESQPDTPSSYQSHSKLLSIAQQLLSITSLDTIDDLMSQVKELESAYQTQATQPDALDAAELLDIDAMRDSLLPDEKDSDIAETEAFLRSAFQSENQRKANEPSNSQTKPSLLSRIPKRKKTVNSTGFNELLGKIAYHDTLWKKLEETAKLTGHIHNSVGDVISSAREITSRLSSTCHRAKDSEEKLDKFKDQFREDIMMLGMLEEQYDNLSGMDSSSNKDTQQVKPDAQRHKKSPASQHAARQHTRSDTTVSGIIKKTNKATVKKKVSFDANTNKSEESQNHADRHPVKVSGIPDKSRQKSTKLRSIPSGMTQKSDKTPSEKTNILNKQIAKGRHTTVTPKEASKPKTQQPPKHTAPDTIKRPSATSKTTKKPAAETRTKKPSVSHKRIGNPQQNSDNKLTLTSIKREIVKLQKRISKPAKTLGDRLSSDKRLGKKVPESLRILKTKMNTINSLHHALVELHNDASHKKETVKMNEQLKKKIESFETSIKEYNEYAKDKGYKNYIIS
ncbi:hypothetical protein CI610_00171 [invertebrate metagenome]|uniref:Uncharacterized protein n=1 Tax=invertebrate metagenome TaxID=1711999 RepID=A0A2H9TCK0_9ZZZZ